MNLKEYIEQEEPQDEERFPCKDFGVWLYTIDDYRRAFADQRFTGTYQEWEALSDEQRASYKVKAD